MDLTEQPAQFRLPRKDLLIAAGLFLLALVIYIRTLAPDILFGDSGEFQILAVTGGLSHATGYPVYLLIAKLFTFLPFGNIAARVNFVSAFFGAIAIGEVFLIARMLGTRRVFSCIGALALMLSPIFWSQSIIAEVYTISAAFFAAFLLCILLWRQGRDSKWLAAGGLLGALCLGLHHTVILTLPIVLVYLILTKARRPDWIAAAGGVAAGVALSFAAYMIEGSIDSAPTATNYLHPYASQYGMKSSTDLDSPLTRVRFEFFADQFSGDVQAQHIALNIPTIAQETINDFGWTIPVLALVGGLTLLIRKGRRREGVLILGSYALLTAFSLTLSGFDVDVEFIQPELLFCVMAAVGMQAVQVAILRGRADTVRSMSVAGFAGILIFAGGSIKVIEGSADALKSGRPTFLTGVSRSFPYPVDRPGYPRALAQSIISHVPDGSMLMLRWTYTYACYYVAQLEENKPGIDIVTQFPEPPPTPKDGAFALNFYLQNAHQRLLFSDRDNPVMETAFSFVPVIKDRDTGEIYLYRLIPRDAASSGGAPPGKRRP